jgi:ABC-type uncharacterized transport system involved in gliding motility auxiliary subunit
MAPRIGSRWQWRLLNASFLMLFLLAVGLLQWLARDYRFQFDLTQNGRHSLSEASIAAVTRLQGPLQITAYASQRGQLRAFIRDFIDRYRKHKPDIALEFVDPDTAPERVRAAGVQFDGEIVVDFGAASETLAPNRLTEEHFTNALTRLGHRGERWLLFLSGHGEASPDRQANFDLSLFAAELRKRGFQTRSLALGDHPQIPQNTATLIVTNPRARLLAGEVEQLADYVKRGGNLLWLQGPGALQGLDRLAENLGIEFLPGVIVDPESEKLVGSATAIVIATYGAHPIVRNFASATLFPYARGLGLTGLESGTDAPASKHRRAAGDNWKSAVLFDTRPTSWAETGPITGAVGFNAGKDLKGPLNLGAALTRDVEDTPRGKREQRVAVIGDGDFLSNRYLGNVGNLELGLSLMNWVAQDDAYVNVPIHTARDRNLSLTRTDQLALALGFLVILPLVLAGSGVFIWLRRRKR